MNIDAHQHFWNYQPEQYSWITSEMPQIRRDFTPEDLKPILEANDIHGCVAVQARQSPEETSYLMKLAKSHDFIKGVVGWVDLKSNKVESMLEYSSEYDQLKGFRHIVQEEKDPNFLLRPSFVRGISCLEKYGFTYDILVFPHQLGAALELVRKFPNQRFVIDHLAKPFIKDGFFDGWAALMQAIAKAPNVWCKVSGMVTEASWSHWKYEDFIPYFDLVFEAFGTDRLMFGSDWPVCLLAGDYGQVKNILDRYLTGQDTAIKEKVFGKNAIQFYDL